MSFEVPLFYLNYFLLICTIIDKYGQGIEMQSLWLEHVIFQWVVSGREGLQTDITCQPALRTTSPLTDSSPVASWMSQRTTSTSHRHALYKAWEKNSSKLKTEAIRKGDGGQRWLWENLLATKNKKGSLIAPQHEGKKTRAQKSLWLIKRSLRERSAKDKFVFFFSPRQRALSSQGMCGWFFRCHL